MESTATAPARKTVALNPDCRRFLAFCRKYLVWIEGPPAGTPIDWLAEPWIVVNYINPLFERDPATGKRRYTTAWCGMAKGNLKSSLGACLALYFLCVESQKLGNRGMQIYAIAASKDQAKIVLGYAARMVEDSPLLRDWVIVQRDSLFVPETKAIFKVLSSDAPKTHGKRPSVIIADELEAHESGDGYSAMETAMVTAAEPLMIVLTNAGASETDDSIWAEVFKRGKDGSDPGMLFYNPMVPEAKLADPAAWKKYANLASFITVERLIELSRKMPPFRFQRWHLNRPTRAEKQWLLPGSWDSCKGDNSLVDGELVVIGVDLAKVHDSSAIVIIAPRDGKYYVQCETWALWADPSKAPPNTHNVVEHGDHIPFHVVFDRIKQLCEQYNVAEVVYDPWGVDETTAENFEADGLPMVSYAMNLSRMGPACNRLFRAVTEQEIVHGGDDMFTAQINAATVKDYGSKRGWMLDKNKARDFMDAAVALCIGLDRAREYMDSGDYVIRTFN